MSHVNIGGAWREFDKAWVNIGGTWREVDKMFTNIGGAWKEGWSFDNVLVYAIPRSFSDLPNRLYAFNGNMEMTISKTVSNHQTDVFDLATDLVGNAYTAASDYGGGTKKTIPNGGTAWTYYHYSGTTTDIIISSEAVCADDSGYCYSSGKAARSPDYHGHIVKHNTNGTEIWRQTQNTYRCHHYEMDVYGGYIYFGWRDDSSSSRYFARRNASDGSAGWSISGLPTSTAGEVHSLKVYNNKIYIAWNNQMKRYSTAGALEWTGPATSCQKIAIDKKNSRVLSLYGTNIHVLNTSGALQFTISSPSGYTLHDIGVDNSGNIYASYSAGDKYGRVMKMSPTGTLLGTGLTDYASFNFFARVSVTHLP